MFTVFALGVESSESVSNFMILFGLEFIVSFSFLASPFNPASTISLVSSALYTLTALLLKLMAV